MLVFKIYLSHTYFQFNNNFYPQNSSHEIRNYSSSNGCFFIQFNNKFYTENSSLHI